MSKKKNKKPIIQNKYTGENLALSKVFFADRWVALTVLDADQKYTLDEARNLVENFKNRRAN